MRLRWYLDLMRVTYSRAAAANVRDIYEFVVDGETAHVIVEDGALEVQDGPAGAAVALRVECDLPTFVALATGSIDPEASGVVTAPDPSAISRCLAILAPT